MTKLYRSIFIILTAFGITGYSCQSYAAEAGASTKGNLQGTDEEIIEYLRNTVPPMITQDMGWLDNITFIDVVSRITPEQREDVITQSLRLLNNNMDWNNRTQIIKDTSDIAQGQRKDVITQVLRALPNDMNVSKYSQIIKDVSRVQGDQREAVITQALNLITDDMNGDSRAEVIDAVAHVAEDQREVFSTQALNLITDDMNGRSRAEVIRAVAFVFHGRQQIDAFVSQIPRLITDNMNGEDRAKVISAVARIAEDHREVFITQALNLITNNMNGEDRAKVIKFATFAPKNQRIARIDRAVAQLAFDRGEGLEPGQPYLQRMRQLLETPLDAPLPPLGGGMAAAVGGGYNAGINVHAQGRDSGTTKAMRLFVTETNRMKFNPKTTEDLFQEFMKFLDGQPEGLKKEKAKKALGLIPADGFGSLLGEGEVGRRVTSNGLNMSAKEFLARLWFYASNYEDRRATDAAAIQREREMAKESILTALTDSVEGDNHVVCNPGKVQRLAVSVLQGRLAGVEVDEGFVESCAAEETSGGGGGGGGGAPTITAADALTLFLQMPGHIDMEAAQATQLREAAEKWLEDRPNVPRKGFQDKLEEYIRTLKKLQ